MCMWGCFFFIPACSTAWLRILCFLTLAHTHACAHIFSFLPFSNPAKRARACKEGALHTTWTGSRLEPFLGTAPPRCLLARGCCCRRPHRRLRQHPDSNSPWFGASQACLLGLVIAAALVFQYSKSSSACLSLCAFCFFVCLSLSVCLSVSLSFSPSLSLSLSLVLFVLGYALDLLVKSCLGYIAVGN